jgi:hypothetical protein
MIRSGGYARQQEAATGAHRRPRKPSPLTRAVAAGAVVVCIGAAYEMAAPAVHALSIVFRTPDGQGNTNEVRVNILHGNIFDPQLGILGANVSNNSTTGDGAVSTPNNPLVDNFIFDNPITRLINAVLNAELVFGPAAAGPINNTTQISFLSFNIFNPQTSIFGGNLSNNTTNSNIAAGYGNNGNASVTSIPGLWPSWFGGMTGNGNALQLAFFSGNIFNPQWSLFGPNVSNNTAITNVATDNGNYSQTGVTQAGGLLGAIIRFWGGLLPGAMTGNGNTTQAAVGTSNITNPQVSIGGSNQSNNTAVTNDANGNGNNSQTAVGGSGSVISTGTTGNGNTNQAAAGTSNIENTQVSIGDVGLTPRPSELSATQSTSTTPTSSPVISTDSTNSSPVHTSGPTSPSSTTESTSSTSGSGATVSSGSTTGSGATTSSGSTTGSGATTSSGSTTGSGGASGGSGGAGTSGGTGGSGG